MPIIVRMPALSPTMESGTLGRWFVEEGATINAGDLLVEIETDKATMEFESIDDGIIARLLVPGGTDDVKVNEPIAIIVDDDEEFDPDTIDLSNSEDVSADDEKQGRIDESRPSSGQDENRVEPLQPTSRLFASPLARRLASQMGIDLATVRGSGPHARIVKSDILEAEQKASRQDMATTAKTMPGAMPIEMLEKIYHGRKVSLVQLDGMRRTVAQRLTESKQTVPHFYLRRSVHLDALLASRSALNQRLADTGQKLSINDFIITAVARALQEVPAANCIWADGQVMQFEASDVAVAVAVKGGLYTPVILDAESKSVTRISAEMKDLATRARSGKLKPNEYVGGTCTISNLGMFGVEDFDAVINPPHSSILAVGAGQRQPVVDTGGSIAIATRMAMTLSVDHRVVDGAVGAEFLQSVVNHLEAPILLSS